MVYALWVDLPAPTPRVPEPSQTFVKITHDKYVPPREIFPIDNWLNTYAEIKWMVHVFCPSDPDCHKAADHATREVLESEYSLELTDDAT